MQAQRGACWLLNLVPRLAMELCPALQRPGGWTRVWACVASEAGGGRWPTPLTRLSVMQGLPLPGWTAPCKLLYLPGCSQSLGVRTLAGAWSYVGGYQGNP